MKLNLLFTVIVITTLFFNQSSFANSNSLNDCQQNDSLNLVAFYDSITSGLTWDLTKPVNTWPGVSLNENGCVTGLNLVKLALTGTIAPEIGSLCELEILNLGSNSLEGEIPKTISNLKSLSYLSLSGNDISGSIPVELGSLDKLEFLSLGGNALTGNIPQALTELKNLKYLSLADNFLNGAIPKQIGSLQALSYFNVCENRLSGALPRSLGSLEKLDTLYLFNNNFEGCYYPELKSLCSLQQISFVDDDDGNEFDASWYSFCEYGEGVCNLYSPCRQQDSLALVSFYNQIQTGLNWDLREPFNTWQGVSLNGSGCVSSLILNAQSLTGTIAPQIGLLNNLDTLDLSDNMLYGEIPAAIGNLQSLNYLNLAKNDLAGNIPKEIGYIGDLQYLSLYFNELYGAIPSTISGLFELQYLSLASNELSGGIPSDLGYLYSLYYLSLSNNELTGTIPKSFDNLYSLDTLYLDNNYLGSCFFKELKNLCDINSIEIVEEQDDDDDDGDANYFTASWSSFCENGDGICDPYSPCRQQDSLTLVAFANAIEGNLNWDLTKTIDTWYGVKLNGYGCVEKLNLEYRNLTGSIPTELSNFENLKELNLQGNALSGLIPVELSKLNTLNQLNLSYNKLSGIIPPELGMLSNLTDLHLNNNSLTGGIPAELFELNNLYNNCNGRGLNLSNNNLGNCFSNLLLPYCEKTLCDNAIANNNFGATWEEFCQFNAGSCCNERAENLAWKNKNYALTESLYEAENSIEIDQSNVALFPYNNTTTLIAGKHILINGNLLMNANTNLILAIDSCR